MTVDELIELLTQLKESNQIKGDQIVRRYENGALIAEYIEIEDLCDESLTMIETEEEEIVKNVYVSKNYDNSIILM